MIQSIYLRLIKQYIVKFRLTSFLKYKNYENYHNFYNSLVLSATPALAWESKHNILHLSIPFDFAQGDNTFCCLTLYYAALLFFVFFSAFTSPSESSLTFFTVFFAVNLLLGFFFTELSYAPSTIGSLFADE